MKTEPLSGSSSQLMQRSIVDLPEPEDPVIPPFLTGLFGRIYAAIANFWAGVMPPMPILGRSLL